MKDFILFAVFLAVIGFMAPTVLVLIFGVAFSFIQWSLAPLVDSFAIINSDKMLFASRISALIFSITSLLTCSD